MNNDGFWLINKEVGWTSFDICAKLRKKLNIKKVGHTGTLDPFATGLLVVATGKCTKLIPFLEKSPKTYVTKIFLGKTSETLDPESEIISCHSDSKSLKIPSKKEIEQVLKEKFTGKIQQIPPKYSALKVNGKPMYKLAREGKEIEIKPRKTEIFKIQILSYKFPELKIELKVSAGFYVRSLARDLGKTLAGCGMCLELQRTKVGELSIQNAEKIGHTTQPIDPRYILTHLEHREIPTGRVQDFISGRAFPLSGRAGESILVLCGNKTCGIGEIIHGNLQPRVVL